MVCRDTAIKADNYGVAMLSQRSGSTLGVGFSFTEELQSDQILCHAQPTFACFLAFHPKSSRREAYP